MKSQFLFLIILSLIFILYSCGGGNYTPTVNDTSMKDDSEINSKNSTPEKINYEEDQQNSTGKNKVDEIPLEKIIGKWEDDAEGVWTFNKNNEFSYIEAQYEGMEREICKGEFQLKENIIFFESMSNKGKKFNGRLELISVEDKTETMELTIYCPGSPLGRKERWFRNY